MSVINNVTNAILDAKTATGVAAGTLGAAAARTMEWLPDNMLTKSATLVGIVLSLVLIYTHIKRHIREERQSELDFKLKREKLKAP